MPCSIGMVPGSKGGRAGRRWGYSSPVKRAIRTSVSVHTSFGTILGCKRGGHKFQSLALRNVSTCTSTRHAREAFWNEIIRGRLVLPPSKQKFNTKQLPFPMQIVLETILRQCQPLLQAEWWRQNRQKYLLKMSHDHRVMKCTNLLDICMPSLFLKYYVTNKGLCIANSFSEKETGFSTVFHYTTYTLPQCISNY